MTTSAGRDVSACAVGLADDGPIAHTGPSQGRVANMIQGLITMKKRCNILSTKALRTREQPINYLLTIALERADLISLAAGFVDNESLPVRDAREAFDEILADPAAGRAALQYGTTAGYPPLRELLLERFARREHLTADALGLTPDHVVVTSGSQQLLYLVSSVLLDPEDIVLLPRPAYFVYMGVLQVFGARVAGIDIDAEGLRADMLDRRLGELDAAGCLDRVKLLYTCSYFDNPTGLTLSARRRRDIIDVVRRWRAKQRFYVLEDAAYRDLVVEPSADVPTMKTMDPDNDLVILTQTFSKPLSPGMKTGYGFLPEALVGPVLDQKSSHDFGSANLLQHAIHRLLVSGRVDRHIKDLRHTYLGKRNAMLGALEEHFGPLRSTAGLAWTRPGGGLYVWLTLPESVNTDFGGSLFQRCLDSGVIYVPGSTCYFEEPGLPVPRNHMRLAFGVPSVEENREGVRRLAQAVLEEMP